MWCKCEFLYHWSYVYMYMLMRFLSPKTMFKNDKMPDLILLTPPPTHPLVAFLSSHCPPQPSFPPLFLFSYRCILYMICCSVSQYWSFYIYIEIFLLIILHIVISFLYIIFVIWGGGKISYTFISLTSISRLFWKRIFNVEF